MGFFDTILGASIRRRMGDMTPGQREALNREATSMFNRAVDEGVAGAHAHPNRFLYDIFMSLIHRGPRER